jgi:hypothetical protein
MMRIVNLSKLIDTEIILAEFIPANRLYDELLRDEVARKYIYLNKIIIR